MRTRWVLGAAALAVLGACARAEERFYSLTMEGKRTGYAHFTTSQVADGVQSSGVTIIKASLLGASFDMSYQSVLVVSADRKRLVRYSLTFRRGTDTSTAECRVRGGKLVALLTTGGVTTRKEHAWSDGSYLVEGNCLDTWSAMFRMMGSRPLRTARVFAPLANASAVAAFRAQPKTTVSVGGKTFMCDRVRMGEGLAGVDLLVDARTRDVVELRAPAQKAAFRLSDRSAMKGIVTYDPGARMFALVDAPLPDPVTLTRLRCSVSMRVAGEKPTPASLTRPWQRFTGTASGGKIQGVFSVEPSGYDGRRAPAFGSRVSEGAIARWLRPEARAESDDPEIRALARELTLGSGTTWDATVKIGNWVHRNIAYAITGSGARECLRTRRGDCGPHTWLTIALCRAAGIPARITGGLLYSRALGGSFGQHYWTVVWMGPDGWIPIDTTTGEIGALSPAHITLWSLGAVDTVRVKVLDYAPKPPKGAAPIVAEPARREFRPALHDSERWEFRQAGTLIGTQTSECTGVGEAAGRFYSDWSLSLRLSTKNPDVELALDGAMSLWSDGAPRWMRFSADANGAKQQGSYTFDGQGVKVDLQVAGQKVQRTVVVTPYTFLQMNNLITPLSLAMRSLCIEPGQTRTAPIFAAAGLQCLDLTFRARAEHEMITVLGKPMRCVVADVEPIANRFTMSAETGELVRVEATGAGLVIERR